MTTSTFTIRADAKQIKRLEALAKSTGRSRSFLAADAIAAYLDVNEWQVEGIRKAIASIDSSGGIDHADVKEMVNAWSATPTPKKAPRKRAS